jgi:hypothetical protein
MGFVVFSGLWKAVFGKEGGMRLAFISRGCEAGLESMDIELQKIYDIFCIFYGM